MQDFLGQEIVVGGWVASSGKGNVVAEYGMILYYVIAVGPKLKLWRLRVRYDKGACTADTVAVTATNPNKYVVVTPPTPVTELFSRVLMKTATPQDHERVGSWIHGVTMLTWE